ncbi:MAG: very short patch repair endonuclease [Bacillota bacterium]
MTDIKSPEARSYNMSKIRGKDTKPELVVRKFLFKNGFRYRIHNDKLPGKPDIVLPKYKTVIFVNGCFWHAHEGCKDFVWPRSNQAFWKDKIEGNVERDRINYEKLCSHGWNVIICWECRLKNKAIRESSLLSIADDIVRNLPPSREQKS